jgi:chemosensory pili system protein ChpB (putative protein-glutamate methylesterase)
MAETTRVALLARAGEVRDRMSAALLRSGAELVLVGDPAELDSAAVRGASPQALLVALDDEVVDSLDALDPVLSDPALQVIYEESELAMRRQGWDEARWVRHLRAKLAGSDDVLPPGAETARAVAPTRVLHGADAVVSEMDFASLAAEAAGHAAVVPAQGQAPADALASNDSLPAAEDAPAQAALATDPPPPDATVGGQAAPAPETAPAPQASHAFDPTALEYALPARAAPPAAPADLVDFDHLFSVRAEVSATPAAAAPAAPAPVAEPPQAPIPRAARALSLTDDTAAPPPALSAEDATFKQSLAGLEQRVAHLELLDDHAAATAEQGCLLVLGGVGGPDAVRQLLAALPADFPRPVLVAQHLDAGRYDKLVTQMSRASAMPVLLAQPGSAPQAGRVYMLPDGVGLGTAARAFATQAGAQWIAALTASDSALVFLSGSDPALVDLAMNARAQGALVLAQSQEGCFDGRAPQALAQRGVQTALPTAMAGLLVRRWRDAGVL